MATDPYKYFRIEAHELVGQLGAGVLELEKGPASSQLVARLLRLAHTLKGAARVVKQSAIAERAHALEDVLEPLRTGDVAIGPGEMETALACLDAIAAHVRALARPASSTAAPSPAPTATAAPVVDEALRAVRIDVEEIDAVLGGLAESAVQLVALREAAHDAERLGHLAQMLAQQLAHDAGHAAPERAGSTEHHANRERTAALADGLAAELASHHRTLRGGVERLDRELAQLRDGAERLRLVPTRAVFAPLERLVRDSAEPATRFETTGGEVRMDAHVLATMQPALVQLVRNAIAHGIEPAAERRASGKPKSGVIRLGVSRHGDHVVFSCEDDGRGLDLAALRRRADAAGGGAAALSDAALVELLLRGGLSTSGSVTELAGRGVGLDVVREAATRLGGEVSASSAPDGGTRFELAVPFSMSSTEVLLVEADGAVAGCGIDAVVQTARVSQDEVTRDPAGDRVVWQGDSLKLVALARLLGRARAQPRVSAPMVAIVVVEHGGARVAIEVDRVREIATVVLRPLPPLAPADAVITGVALDQRGDPFAVLDAAGVVAAAHRAVGSAPRPATAPRRRPVLVIDDSITTRMLEQSILESAGHEVELAASAEEALHKAQHGEYSLFMVDVEMPGMDGFEFVARTRADPRLRDVPAILVTSREAPEDRERGRIAGAAAYIVKREFDQRALLDLLDRLGVGGSVET